MIHILAGLIITVVGFLIVAKSEWLLGNFGRIDFFEQKMGTSGGSRLGYKLIGMVVIFLGVLIFTNMIGGFLMWVLSPLLKYSMPM